MRRGFSLLEMTLALVVFGLLAGGLVKSVAAQREQARISEAKILLASVREALIGFALAQGRLPCPATPDLPANAASAGSESVACANNCASDSQSCLHSQEHGVVPWQALGIAATDPWGNRLTYFVDRKFSMAPSEEESRSGMRSHIRLDSIGSAKIQEQAGTLSEIPAVIISHGPRAAGAYSGNGQRLPGATGDEAENADSDLNFIARLADDSFDDLLNWLPSTILKARLAGVGKLP